MIVSSWAEIVERVKAEAGACANSANSANRGAKPAETGPNGTNGTNGNGSLPAPVQTGLRRLRTMAAPRITAPEVWPEIVEDAARLANEGWAAQALALGWSPLHLWGCSPEPGGNTDHEGLAVWLRGRPVLLLDSHSCLVETAPRHHSIFNARPMPGAVLLWELGGGG